MSCTWLVSIIGEYYRITSVRYDINVDWPIVFWELLIYLLFSENKAELFALNCLYAFSDYFQEQIYLDVLNILCLEGENHILYWFGTKVIKAKITDAELQWYVYCFVSEISIHCNLYMECLFAILRIKLSVYLRWGRPHTVVRLKKDPFSIFYIR